MEVLFREFISVFLLIRKNVSFIIIGKILGQPQNYDTILKKSICIE